MSLMRYPNRALSKPPRAFVLAERAALDSDRRHRPTAQSVEPLMGLYAQGALPLDAMGKRAIASYLDSAWGKLQRTGGPEDFVGTPAPEGV